MFERFKHRPDDSELEVVDIPTPLEVFETKEDFIRADGELKGTLGYWMFRVHVLTDRLQQRIVNATKKKPPTTP